ncbi:MAG: ZIP family metal transporter [Bacilli bacterium]|nr:ZIP family metal transporter [Bacilli bacterium]
MDWFINLNPILQSLCMTLFTWGMTLLGSSIVFFFKNVNKTLMNIMLGIASGIMLAASYFSLLSPALDMTISLNMSWVMILLGFIAGSLLIFISDNIYSNDMDNKKRNMMLISSITLHNIPEGLVIGVAFGSLAYGLDGNTLLSCVALAIGIGLQNFPEGAAVSLPLRRDGYSRFKAFIYGQLSGVVEPIAGVLGCILVLKIRYMLPFALSLAAGAMIYVVIKELVPESQSNDKKDIISLATLFGFALMMIMDITL